MNFFRIIATLGVFLFSSIHSFNSQAQVRISEFMQSNIDCLMDPDYDFPDSWIELENQANVAASVWGWYISNDPDYRKGWQIFTGIRPNGYLVIYCDKVANGFHTNFRLETSKKSNIYIFDQDGNLMDQILNIPPQPAPNISAGRDENDSLVYYVTPTPRLANIPVTAKEVTPDPVFNTLSGIYKSSVIVELADTSKIEGAKIYYTLDSSEPTGRSTIYESPIQVDSTTVVKAKIIANNYLTPRAVTNSYIIMNRETELPIISLSTDKSYLWNSNIGIYTVGTNGAWNGCGKDTPYANYRQNWRRPITFEYFPHQDETSVINQLGETRIMGGCSREFPVKSMALYSHKRFGKKEFSYPIFQNEDKRDVKIKSLMLRNSGQDWEHTFFKDALVHSLMAGKLDLDYQAYQPAILYLNGDYRGLINIRERSNEDNVYGNYNKLENIDMIENWNEVSTGEVKAGDTIAFQILMDGLKQQLFTYDELQEMIDIPQFINYSVLQMFIANVDFPRNNVIFWKERKEGAKWRFILKDADAGLGRNANIQSNFNAFEYMFNPIEGGSSQNSELSTRLFRSLMAFDEFKSDFERHFTAYMGDILSEERILHIADSLQSKIEPEMAFHVARHNPYTMEEWHENVTKMKKWINERYVHQYTHIKDYYGYGELVKLSIGTPIVSIDKSIQFNGVNLLTNRFNAMYYKGQNIELEWTSEDPSFNFEGWKTSIVYEGESSPVITDYYSKAVNITVANNVKEINIIPFAGLVNIVPTDKSKVEIQQTLSGVSISNMEGKTTIEVLNLEGQLIKRINTKETSLDIDLYQSGVYIFKIANEEAQVVKKVQYKM